MRSDLERITMFTSSNNIRACILCMWGMAATAGAQEASGPPAPLLDGLYRALSPGVLKASATNPEGLLRINLPDAKARAAAATKAAELGRLNVAAARYHRQAAQADYFPKVSSTLVNLHFNKFMGQEFALVRRNVFLPLVAQDQTVFGVTVAQPVTPLFKVRQAVQIARADERIAQAKVNALRAQTDGSVERAYFNLLIAQRQQVSAEIKVKLMTNRSQVATVALHSAEPAAERQMAFAEATKALLIANSKVIEMAQSLNALMGLPADTRLELAEPSPMIETVSSGQPAQQSIDSNPEVVEAEETLVKARAAAHLSKLDYVPDVAAMWGYYRQTVIPALPGDFSFVGFVASWNVFDSGKRERTASERSTQVRMAEINLQLVRGKVAASVQKASLDLQRTRRILQLTRQVASMYATVEASYSGTDLEARAARAQSEAEMFQAELEYRIAYAELQRLVSGGAYRTAP